MTSCPDQEKTLELEFSFSQNKNIKALPLQLVNIYVKAKMHFK